MNLFKNIGFALLFLTCFLNANPPMLQLVAANRHATIYSSSYIFPETPYGPAKSCLIYITTTPEATFTVETTMKCSDLAEGARYTSRGWICPKEENDSLPQDTIAALPLKGADLLGVEIARNLYSQLGTTYRVTAAANPDIETPVKPPRQLVVWQSVAIDPAFEYETFYNDDYDYIVVENALFQQEDVTQTITNPKLFFTGAEQTPPSHATLFANAISRATMPCNMETTKHKILLVYANDIALMSPDVITTLSSNNWFLGVLGEGDELYPTGAQALAPFGNNMLYINSLNITQEQIKDTVVSAYLQNSTAPSSSN